ncbi:hypothetical protein [Nocardia sp. AG03]|uniref:hypothetical protein n=1 Tax=Nocardia sp. AG03 TaxID=3025312 RepID=UPI0024184AA5|nr:hypothetical protein [Nocardia sp. AG03]
MARHPRLPRQTALKLLNPELFADTEIRARFEREADLAAQLEHPNIVTVYDRGPRTGSCGSACSSSTVWTPRRCRTWSTPRSRCTSSRARRPRSTTPTAPGCCTGT